MRCLSCSVLQKGLWLGLALALSYSAGEVLQVGGPAEDGCRKTAALLFLVGPSLKSQRKHVPENPSLFCSSSPQLKVSNVSCH